MPAAKSNAGRAPPPWKKGLQHVPQPLSCQPLAADDQNPAETEKTNLLLEIGLPLASEKFGCSARYSGLVSPMLVSTQAKPRTTGPSATSAPIRKSQ